MGGTDGREMGEKAKRGKGRKGGLMQWFGQGMASGNFLALLLIAKDHFV
jgi:hypothetical protein